MFDTKLRALAHEVFNDKLNGNPADALRLMAWLAEVAYNSDSAGTWTNDQVARLQDVCSNVYDEVSRKAA